MVRDLSADVLGIARHFLVGNCVWTPREGPKMENCEHRHLYTNEEIRNPNLEILAGHFLARFDGTRRREERNDGCLPERQENDQLDRKNLQKWMIFSEIVANLEVELD